jgi:hypothetical protein
VINLYQLVHELRESESKQSSADQIGQGKLPISCSLIHDYERGLLHLGHYFLEWDSKIQNNCLCPTDMSMAWLGPSLLYAVR